MAKEITPPQPPKPALWSVSATSYDNDDRPTMIKVVATTIPEAVQKAVVRFKELNKALTDESSIVRVELVGRES